ncbi:MAG: penicillin acylase family protein, partial [Hyphomicrobiales bacterium]
RAPQRPNHDGLMPVPGDGRYEWTGFLKAGELPEVYNPTDGFFATANEMNIPKDHPLLAKRIGFEWSDPSRIKRIKAVLGTKNKVTLADAMALQNDDNSENARKLAALLAPLSSDDPVTAEGLKLIKGWNQEIAVDSAAAALSEVWMSKHLGRALTAKAVPEKARSVIGPLDVAAVVAYLEAPDSALGTDPKAARNNLLLETLKAAMEELRQTLGPDTATWNWGKIHHAQFDHALSPLAGGPDRAQLNVGRLAMGGSAFSPRAASYRISDFKVIAGASFRMVLDVGNWDDSRFVNTPGQSGDAYSPHYRDLAPLWAAGDYAPLLYSREAVEKAARSVIALKPAG